MKMYHTRQNGLRYSSLMPTVDTRNCRQVKRRDGKPTYCRSRARMTSSASTSSAECLFRRSHRSRHLPLEGWHRVAWWRDRLRPGWWLMTAWWLDDWWLADYQRFGFAGLYWVNNIHHRAMCTLLVITYIVFSVLQLFSVLYIPEPIMAWKCHD